MKATNSSNCENDFDYNLFDPNSQNALSTSYTDTETLVESVSDSFIYSEEEGTFDQCLSNNEETITLETCSNAYFAGYLAKKCIDQYKSQKYLKDCVELSPHKRKLCATIQQKIKMELISDLNFNTNCEPHTDFIV
ncbi:hypothetical protein QTP88_012368 [Uroleucon formosanum]